MSNRHAYLVAAHNQPELLCHLLKALDYPYNDIYLHLDKKMQVCPYKLRNQIRQGRLFILPERMDVKWGHFSMIQCELLLLEAASKEQHDYYHLMSGTDLPLKSQNEIHRFFQENNGLEFVHFQSPQISEKDKLRVSKYHFIVKRQQSKRFYQKVLGKILLGMQLGIDRTRPLGITFQKGANWFSITHELAEHVLSRKDFVLRNFKYTLCADEIFLQTLVYNSDFRNKVVGSNYRDNYANICYHIDWKRGTPYEFVSEDYDELISSDMLFARKFNWRKDRDIICRVVDHVTAGDRIWEC